jgi:3'-phosphoadenosine 5'-phosphosulfate sulfotransferase (PAPS reductase)/FAD synthetase
MRGEALDKDGNPSKYNQQKWKWLMDSPFKISAECCRIMKKTPLKLYQRETGKYPITAQMACESRLRYQQWLKNGCNGFDMKSPISNPLSFWTE